jgi:hypothetical protein
MTMANEKSRNHDTKGGTGGASKHQGKPKDQAESGAKTSDGKTGAGPDKGSDSKEPGLSDI